MIGQVFILDYNITYDDEEGLNSSLYIVDSTKINDVQHMAKQTVDNWNNYYENNCTEDSDCLECFGDEFERLMQTSGIIFQRVGDITLFEKADRLDTYIADNVIIVEI